MKLVDSSIGEIIGQITPPPGPSQLYGDPIVGIGKLFGTLLTIFMLVAGVSLLIYLMWGALDWIFSEGDKEKLNKAQGKITNALIGMLWIVVGLTLFGLITGNILGIIRHTDQGWQFDIPIINGGSGSGGTGGGGGGGGSGSGRSCYGTCRAKSASTSPCFVPDEREDRTLICPSVPGTSQVCCIQTNPTTCTGWGGTCIIDSVSCSGTTKYGTDCDTRKGPGGTGETCCVP